MRARIYKPAKTAMQSGTAKSKGWVLQFSPVTPRGVDPLMGWTSSTDTQSQVSLRFATQEAAEAYAKEHGIEYTVLPVKERKPNVRPGGYGENFAPGRRMVWTH